MSVYKTKEFSRLARKAALGKALGTIRANGELVEIEGRDENED